MLPCVGLRCCTTTYARPVSAGTFRKNSDRASSPPADAPMPTTVTGELRTDSRSANSVDADLLEAAEGIGTRPETITARSSSRGGAQPNVHKPLKAQESRYVAPSAAQDTRSYPLI